MERSFKNDLLKGEKDFINSFVYWRIFCLIGINDIRKRYARSKLGQFWLTLSLAINIASLSLVWSFLLKIPIVEYLPYFASSIIIWNYMSTCLIEGVNVYISSASYLKELDIPKLAYVNALFVRNIIILGHNLLVLIPIWLVCNMPFGLLNFLLSICGFILTCLFLLAVVMLVSIIGLRFRDFPNIVVSLLQIIFYISPVMWKIELLPEKFGCYLILNPFAVFLSLCREPLLNHNVAGSYWLAGVIYSILVWLIAFPLFSRFRCRIVYWL